jgi:hypothetical protein
LRNSPSLGAIELVGYWHKAAFGGQQAGRGVAKDLAAFSLPVPPPFLCRGKAAAQVALLTAAVH